MNQPGDAQYAKELREKLDEAFLRWRELAHIPEERTAAVKAQRTVSHLNHAFSAHVVKHGCSK